MAQNHDIYIYIHTQTYIHIYKHAQYLQDRAHDAVDEQVHGHSLIRVRDHDRMYALVALIICCFRLLRHFLLGVERLNLFFGFVYVDFVVADGEHDLTLPAGFIPVFVCVYVYMYACVFVYSRTASTTSPCTPASSLYVCMYVCMYV
jgi:hypothetical protein